MVINKSILKFSGISAVFASLCCLSPLLLVIFGISTVSFAASLTDNLYGNYKWYFRAVGLIFLTIFMVLYYRKKGICTIDEAKKQRTKIINEILIALISFVILYVIFLYVIVEWVGKLYGIWG
ncbi:MAG: hypothetical protein IH845_03580 [Nanoarchaeota archaeon]|nr:hypothetical protein [Nanoarchaeota archaeon]